MKNYEKYAEITESPFSGKIYQYGNYSDGEWWEIGSTGGYA